VRGLKRAPVEPTVRLAKEFQIGMSNAGGCSSIVGFSPDPELDHVKCIVKSIT